MKKIFSFLIIFLMIFNFSFAQANAAIDKKMNANLRTKRVPEGTIINLKLLNSIDSAQMKLGDSFNLMVAENVIVNNETVIPQGSVIRGSVDEVRAPKLFYRGGVIRLYFDHIVSSTGKQVPVYAVICQNSNLTLDGALGSNTKYSDALGDTVQTTKDIVVNPTSWAWDKGDELLNGSPKYIMAPLTAIVCTPIAGVYFIGGAIYDIFKKGENVYLNKGEIIKIQLLKPLDMPAY